MENETRVATAPHDVSEIPPRFRALPRRSVKLKINAASDVRLTIVADRPVESAVRFLRPWLRLENTKPGISVLPPLEPLPKAWRRKLMGGLPPKRTDLQNVLLWLAGAYAFAIATAFITTSPASRTMAVYLEIAVSLALLASVSLWRYHNRRKAMAQLSVERSALPSEMQADWRSSATFARPIQLDVESQSVRQ